MNAEVSPPSLNTEHQSTWAHAERWIYECLNNHSACNTSFNNTWVPSRLLDLSGVKDAGKVKLLETTQTETNGKYMTLSHRWGGKSPLSLNRHTYEQLLAGVELHLLPQAFRDAVTICQRLQISYLWIDSLCIAQDDHQDWTKEAALMHKVYSRSFLNISSVARL